MPIGTQPRHRHFVVAPLALGLFAISLTHGIFFTETEQVTATLISGPADTRMIETANGEQLVLFDTAMVTVNENGIELHKGSVLVKSEGISRVRMGDSEVIGMGGAYHLSYSDTATSIVSITTPVLFLQDQTRVIVPMNKQWRGDTYPLSAIADGIENWRSARTFKDTPKRFLREQLTLLSRLPAVETDVSAAREALTSPFSLPDSLLLESSKKQSRLQTREELLRILQVAVEEGDIGTIQQLLSLDSTVSLLQDSEIQQMISILFSRAAMSSSAMAMPLVDLLSADPDVWLLLSMHPDYASLAWSAPLPVLSRERMMLVWEFLPKANFLPQAFGGFVMDGWIQSVQLELMDMRNPAAIINQLVSQHAPLVDTMIALQYPERAKRLADALRTIARPYYQQLSDYSRTELSRFAGMDRVIVVPLSEARIEDEEVEQKSVVSGQKSVEEESYSSKQQAVSSKQGEIKDLSPDDAKKLEEEVFQLVDTAGALITLKTQINAVAPNTVQVTDLVFSNPSKDRTFSFVVNTEEHEVGNLQEGETSYPLALPFEQFVEWARSD